MARKTINFTVPDGESTARDKGKLFCITEMPALRAEAWATRALIALMGSGVQMPADAVPGMATLVEVGYDSLQRLKYETLEPLLTEMLGCVQYFPDASRPSFMRHLFVAGSEDIEDVATLVMLRLEVWRLHTDFLQAGALSKFGARVTAENPASST